MKSAKRVLLGMSGGTDSSVAAMLLQEAGYEVTGVTFRFYDSEGFEESLDDARNLASRLNIPHIIYDARELFRERIIRYFVDEYLSARFRDGYYFIAPAADRDKDQTFFLWGLQQNILERMLLPMGDWTKNEVRAYAAKRGFERTATKKDSLGVCFCPMDYRSFLQREVPQDALPGKGQFLDESGTFLGWHEGYPFYTIGQRRGLGIHLNRPVFVKEIHKERNEVILAPLASLYKEEMLLKDWNIVDTSRLLNSEDVIVRIRYRKQANHCTVSITDENLLHVLLREPLESIASGQAAAFYDEAGLLLGGGIIL